MEREPAVAGMFYPEDKEELVRIIDTLIDNIKFNYKGKMNGILVPHAGYVYSAQTATYAYKPLREKRIKKVIILCPNHTAYVKGCCLDKFDIWKTPLGEVKVEQELREQLNSKKYFYSDNLPHIEEHAIEVQLPFLQIILKDFTFVPIVVGEISTEEAESIARTLLNTNAFIIISSDLSHYLSFFDAEKRDKNTISIIESLDIKNFEQIDACGKYPILIMMHLAKLKKSNPKLIFYDTSATASKDKSMVVGYGSFVF